ncbi:unnamed protein product [Lactuca virosa]|uniref:Replication factor A C-terminal domain-containing protein n=1 Tax=Lactuca virosa TaxID=75947 RepID=A0AAU9P7V4_9ASTR|nr:unnamed protein product [Lactuca virosa]
MTAISELKYGCIGGPLQVRILRKWKPDNRRHETWYLAVDKFGDAIQILGQRTNQGYIESILTISDCFTIDEYTCPLLDQYQKMLEQDFYIDVGIASTIQPMPNTSILPTSWFRFLPKKQILELGENPPYCPDFIGVITKVKDCNKKDGEPFLLLVLADENGDELAINLWKECTKCPEKFDRQKLLPLPVTTVVAVTNLKASRTDVATHLYVNPDIPDTALLIHRYTGPTTPISEHTGIQTTIDDLTKRTRSELLDKTFNLKASIQHVFFKDYWCQVTCPVCKDPIFEKGTNWFCSAHDETGVLSASITDSVARKIIGKGPDKLFAENTHLGRRNLPTSIKTNTSPVKQMTIQLLRTSAAGTIRFLLVDIADLQPVAQSTIPQTPTPMAETRLPDQYRKDSIGSTTSQKIRCLKTVVLHPFRETASEKIKVA